MRESAHCAHGHGIGIVISDDIWHFLIFETQSLAGKGMTKPPHPRVDVLAAT